MKLLSVVVTKRIKQDLCITLSAKEFMPDILEDWRVAGEAIPRICEEEDCPYVISYATHTWREMWRLPPSVNEDALDGDDATLAAHTSGDSGVVVEFSKRDAIFLKGRRAREAPALSLGLALVVTLQFLFSLVVGYSFLLQSGDKREVSLERHPLLSGNSNATGGVDAFGAALAVAEEEERTTRVCNAMVCIGCVLLLQMIKFYYK